ncbi:MAG TPA: sensor histidine kinase, partial [Kiritimatiellia bacterium]
HVVSVRTADLQNANERIEKEMQERLRLENEILEVSSSEKERVGRDLHDSLGQKLTGAAFLSRALIDRFPDADADGKDSARKINEIIKETVTQVRRIARGLSPVELGEEGLIDALRLLAEETEQTCGISCTFKTAGDSPARTGSVALHLYHIAQEAISNAVRHGKARHITIALDPGSMSIDDDGTGMPADATKHGGMGLKLMRYRAAMIGGSLDIGNRTGGGTRLTCRFGGNT